MGISRRKVEVIARAARAFSLSFQAVSDEADWSLSERVPDRETRSPADILSEGRRVEAVMKHLAAVDQRAGEILRLRFGLGGRDPMTLKEIGKKVGLTRDTLRSINEAIRKQEDKAYLAVVQ